LVALDLVVFFAIFQPLGTKLEAEARGHEDLRRTIRNQELRVELLKNYQAALPDVAKGLDDFASNRAPSRREAYSTAAHLVHKLADAAGVKVSSMEYRLDTAHVDSLERLSLEINLQGPYQSLLKFSHGLETATDFITVREFDFEPGENGDALRLRLGADLYLTP
jgi:Tfp pilus assembly protein PilO